MISSRRVLAILSARLRAHMGGELIPFAALLAQGSLVGALTFMVRDQLPPWGFALFILFASGGLVLLTLLGEFGSLLRTDPAAAWSEALPASAMEQRLGRALAVLVLLALLSFSVLLPAVLLAPPALGWDARALLLLAGVGQAIALGSTLLVLQSLFGDRIESALLLLQTVLVVGAVTGLLNAPGLAPGMRAIELGEAPWPDLLSFAPPTWYASLVASAPASAGAPHPAYLLAGTLVALALLALLPPGRERGASRDAGLVQLALRPLRALATRTWVTRDERGVFDLVYDALPRERDFVLRTYPMIGIPLAFLVAGADGADGEGLRDLLALLLFTPAVYLPVLLAHVPVTSSPEARWLLETAPIGPMTIESGAVKALAVRFILPLYLVLAGLAAFFAGPFFALRLAVPGLLVTLVALRLLYPRCVLGLPLSTAADRIEVRHDWTGFLLTLAVVLTLLAITAQRLVTDLPRAAGLVAGLLLVSWVLERGSRRATTE